MRARRIRFQLPAELPPPGDFGPKTLNSEVVVVVAAVMVAWSLLLYAWSEDSLCLTTYSKENYYVYRCARTSV